MNITERIELYCNLAVGIANDDTHGYSQINRNGNPDFDCSSLVLYCLRQSGFKMVGASHTGNMYNALIGEGFKAVTGAYKRGDILLSHNSRRQHTAIYIGNNKIVHARSSETGGKTGKPGDQTGNEICITNVSCFAPDYIFRISESEVEQVNNIYMPTLRQNDKCYEVGVLQALLNEKCGYFLKVDNDFGEKTADAVFHFQCKCFPKEPNEHDKIVGVKTWTKLLKGGF